MYSIVSLSIQPPCLRLRSRYLADLKHPGGEADPAPILAHDTCLNRPLLRVKLAVRCLQ